jgi:hypothetical protein
MSDVKQLSVLFDKAAHTAPALRKIPVPIVPPRAVAYNMSLTPRQRIEHMSLTYHSQMATLHPSLRRIF